MKQKITDLIDQYLDIVHSKRNEENKKYWTHTTGWNRDMWRGFPKKSDRIPFTIAPDNSLWSYILNVDLRDYYSNPEIYLETQLRSKIYAFKNFNDNTYFTEELFIWFGVVTELSFFKAKINFFANKEGWIDENLIKDYNDLNRMETPDFYRSGLMPLIHQYYEVFNEYAQGKLKVMFPEWVRGPFCIATHLRGMQNILMDLILEPDSVHRLMRFIVDSSKLWNSERDKFLGTPVKTCRLYNDEIGSPTLSPELYKEFVFPYEKELSDYYGEITYWHSCGNTTDFIEQINRLSNLKMFHCGPWTSPQAAVEKLNNSVALDICLNPQLDVLEADDQQMKDKIKSIVRACSGFPITVRADGFMLEGAPEKTLSAIERWSKIAKVTLNRIE